MTYSNNTIIYRYIFGGFLDFTGIKFCCFVKINIHLLVQLNFYVPIFVFLE